MQTLAMAIPGLALIVGMTCLTTYVVRKRAARRGGPDGSVSPPPLWTLLVGLSALALFLGMITYQWVAYFSRT